MGLSRPSGFGEATRVPNSLVFSAVLDAFSRTSWVFSGLDAVNRRHLAPFCRRPKFVLLWKDCGRGLRARRVRCRSTMGSKELCPQRWAQRGAAFAIVGRHRNASPARSRSSHLSITSLSIEAIANDRQAQKHSQTYRRGWSCNSMGWEYLRRAQMRPLFKLGALLGLLRRAGTRARSAI